ncbi:MAG: DUF4139 domain-containing protein [Synergistaceae bacterium]|nr:DUF4139 domain-containing protein [Synergistaceae bacterium]
MKSLTVLLLLTTMLIFPHGTSYALDVPEKYTDKISAVDFFPTGARFTFVVEPEDESGNFRALIPGAFRPESIRLLNPESVYGDIYVSSYSRTKWTPSQLESLRLQAEEQSKIVSDLNSRKSAFEQTLAFLKNATPEKSKPQELLQYIQEAQGVRLAAENGLSALRVKLNQEQEKLRMLNQELQNKRPAGDTRYTEVTGRARGMVYIEAFTDSASWRPKYILDLYSSTGEIAAGMYILASQRTGLDFTGTITLHTKTPDERVTTPEVSPLKVSIKPKEQVIASNSAVSITRTNRQFKSARAAMNEADMYMAAEEMADVDENALGVQAPKAPSVTETLSDRTVAVAGTLAGDGTERVFEASAGNMTMSSKVELIMIPEQRTNAWIIASMDEGNDHMIPGEAELRVDGHSSGKIYIEEYGIGQKKIPFGYADQITAKKERLVEKTGVQWFSGVFTSGYKLEITNGTKKEQVITVKDRLPIPTDEKIKLDIKRIEPKEKERDKENRLTWEITVPAGATVPIIVDYTLSYPSGEELEYK